MVLLTIILAIKHEKAKDQAEYYRRQWGKWEEEYWYLRKATDIDKTHDVYLSWLPRGGDHAIKKKEIKENYTNER